MIKYIVNSQLLTANTQSKILSKRLPSYEQKYEHCVEKDFAAGDQDSVKNLQKNFCKNFTLQKRFLI